MSNVLSAYLKDVSKTRLLTKEEEVSLSQRIEKGDRAARDEMTRCNLRLAISIAKKHSRRGCNFEDLIQEANIGLMKAVDRFDWRRGFKFSTYACWWIKQSVNRHISMHRNTVRIPAHTSGLVWKIKCIVKEYETEFDQEPTPSEIADLLGVSLSMVEAAIQSMALQNMYSLDATVGADGEGRLFSEMISDESWVDPAQTLDQRKLMMSIKSCLKNLSEREEKILRLRFGISEDLADDQSFDLKQQSLSEWEGVK
jgi:RNA polymerase primary sigma factor